MSSRTFQDGQPILDAEKYYEVEGELQNNRIVVHVIKDSPPVNMHTRYRAIKLSHVFPELF